MAPDTLDQTLREWAAQYCSEGAPVALDGKELRGASKQIAGERRMMVAAVEHGSGLVLGQLQLGDKTNEIPAVRELSQQQTARCLADECEVDYVITAVKDNQPTIHYDLKAM